LPNLGPLTVISPLIITADASQMLRLVFVDHKLPYYYLKANKKTVVSGESVNYSVRSNNVKNLKTTKITLPITSTLASIENVVVHDAVNNTEMLKFLYPPFLLD
jgi:hypothetical protein